MKRYLLLFAATLIALSVVTWGVSSIFNKDKGNAELNIEVVPTDSKIEINGSRTSSGIVRIKEGSYTVTVNRDGFAEQKVNVEISQHEEKYIGVALEPNHPSTKDWYERNVNDRKLAEGLSSRTYDEASKNLMFNYPLFRQLPTLEQDFTISYGVSMHDPDNPERYALHILAASPLLRSAAIDWVKQQGYDPTDYEFYFEQLNNIFEGVE
jgi:hypothetical protein